MEFTGGFEWCDIFQVSEKDARSLSGLDFPEPHPNAMMGNDTLIIAEMRSVPDRHTCIQELSSHRACLDDHLGTPLDIQDTRGKTPLHVVAQRGNVTVVNALLIKGALVDIKDDKGYTPLHRAARSGHRDVVELLLNHGANIENRGKCQRTPFYSACRKGHCQVAVLLKERGANVFITNSDGNTALYIAAYREISLIRFLLGCGINVNQGDNRGCSPLMVAVGQQKSLETIKLLLDAGALVNQRDAGGRTALHWVCHHGTVDTFHLLMSHQADVQQVTISNGNCLMFACHGGQLEITKILVTTYGFNPQGRQDSLGETALHKAVRSEGVSVLRWLLSSQGTVDSSMINCKSKTGRTALSLAANLGRLTAVQTLIDNGANLETPTNRGITPLMDALQRGDREIIRLLLTKGAKIDTTDEAGWNALHRGVFYGSVEGVREFLDHHPTTLYTTTKDLENVLTLAIQNVDIKMMKFMVEEKRVSVTTPVKRGLPPIGWALWLGDREKIDFLLSKGATVHFISSAEATALSVAIEGDRPAISEWLVAWWGFDPHRRYSTDNTTLLHFAANQGSLKCLRFLLDQGLSVADNNNSSGCTPLHAAVEREHVDCVKELLLRGAPIEMKTKCGKTPLDLAMRTNNKQIIRILFEAGASSPEPVSYKNDRATESTLRFVVLFPLTMLWEMLFLTHTGRAQIAPPKLNWSLPSFRLCSLVSLMTRLPLYSQERILKTATAMVH